MIQPGPDTVEKLGGLQKMTAWNGPMLTDSGGFQIFSLGHGGVSDEIKGVSSRSKSKSLLRIEEDGATFKSYTDGALHKLTPEKSIDIQTKLGADLIVVLDECTPYHVDKAYTQRSMEMSHRWALRSHKRFEETTKGNQALYGIIQGGIYNDLRQASAEFVNSTPFFGNAVGGCLGAGKDQMDDVVALTMSFLNPERPVHLLGIGMIRDIFANVVSGIDTFDCVHPTRLARHGGAIVPHTIAQQYGSKREHINLLNAQFTHDDTPIDPTCTCRTCAQFSKGYIHHLFKANELLGTQALSVHNVHTMNRLMVDVREGIAHNTLNEKRQFWIGDK
jgi:queuine tRNA-ribosyltransferase